MKRLLTLGMVLLVVGGMAMASDVKIDAENCTITKDGKTYNLYGKVKIVDSFEWSFSPLYSSQNEQVEFDFLQKSFPQEIFLVHYTP